MIDNYKNLPNYLMNTDEEDALIYETSFVEEPATGFDFLKFSKGEVQVKTMEFKQVETSEFKRMVSGVWFMPDTKYLRYDKNRGLYTVEFKREALKDALIKYLKNDLANSVKVEHQGQYLDGFVAMEHWIYDEENKVSPIFKHTLQDLGYTEEDVKYGTVFKTVYIKDEQFWNDEVMTGKVKGFSIGGLFTLEEENMLGEQMFSDVAENTTTVSNTGESIKDAASALLTHTQDVPNQGSSAAEAAPSQRVERDDENANNSTPELNTETSLEAQEEKEEISTETSTQPSTEVSNEQNNTSTDNNLFELIQNLQQEMLSIKQSLNDKDAQNALLSSELNSLKAKQEEVQKENETLKTQVKNSPINKSSFNPSSVKVNSNPDNTGKKLIGGFWV